MEAEVQDRVPDLPNPQFASGSKPRQSTQEISQSVLENDSNRHYRKYSLQIEPEVKRRSVRRASESRRYSKTLQHDSSAERRHSTAVERRMRNLREMKIFDKQRYKEEYYHDYVGRRNAFDLGSRKKKGKVRRGRKEVKSERSAKTPDPSSKKGKVSFRARQGTESAPPPNTDVLGAKVTSQQSNNGVESVTNRGHVGLQRLENVGTDRCGTMGLTKDQMKGWSVTANGI